MRTKADKADELELADTTKFIERFFTGGFFFVQVCSFLLVHVYDFVNVDDVCDRSKQSCGDVMTRALVRVLSLVAMALLTMAQNEPSVAADGNNLVLTAAGKVMFAEVHSTTSLAR